MNDLGAGANVTTKKYNNLAEADPDEFAPKTHAELEQRIALLERVAIKARMYIDDIGECDFIELDEALTTAGYTKGEDTWNCHQCCHSFPDSHKPVYLNHMAYCSDECADNRMAEL